MAHRAQPRQQRTPTFTSVSASRPNVGRPATPQVQLCTRTVFEELTVESARPAPRHASGEEATPVASPPKYELLGLYRAATCLQETHTSQGALPSAVGGEMAAPEESPDERTRLLSGAVRRYDGSDSRPDSESDSESDSDDSLPSYSEARRDMPPRFRAFDRAARRGGLRIWSSSHEWLDGRLHRVVYERLPEVEAQMQVRWDERWPFPREESPHRAVMASAEDLDGDECGPVIGLTMAIFLIVTFVLALMFLFLRGTM